MQRVLSITLASLAFGATAMAETKNWAEEVRATAEKCGIPKDRMQWVDGSVIWHLPESSTYEQAKCVLEELKARGVPMKQGFVGNGS